MSEEPNIIYGRLLEGTHAAGYMQDNSWQHDNPNVMYGRLLEAVHVAGYTFERAWLQLEQMLADQAWRQVGPGFTDINAFLATIHLPEGVTPDRRKKVAERIKELQPTASQRKIAGVLGVTNATVSRDLQPPVTHVTPQPGAASNGAAKPAPTVTHATPPPPDGATVAREAAQRHEAKVIRAERHADTLARLDDIATREAKALAGVYDVVVIDPPWPMEKIERDVRPNQVAFDYPTMDEEAIAAQIETLAPFAADCHVWLWTTQRFWPMAWRLMQRWQLTYVCTFVWHKPGGFQPVGLPQYNTEFAFYARRGAPVFVDTTAFQTGFSAPRTTHSTKPEEFYAMVRRVTKGRRLDLFNRRAIEGFEGWGQESSDVRNGNV